MSRYTSIMQMRAERRARIAERFKEHRAERRIFADGIEEIRWRKPGTGIDSMHLLISGPHLIVTGDLGDAIYTRECGWAFWASCDLDYFASKCVASDTGRLAREWDSDRAELYMAEVLGTTVEGLRPEVEDAAEDPSNAEERDEGEDDDLDEEDETQKTRLTRFRERGGASALDSEFEWISWLHQFGYDVFGSDYYEHGEAGRNVSYRCLFHLEGVKAAVAQLGLGSRRNVA